MSDVLQAKAELTRIARELGQRSTELARVSRELDQDAGPAYHTFVDDYELGLWQRSQDEDSYKLPPAALRLKLAHKHMDPAVLGRYMGLVKSRERLVQRISDLKHESEAQRSILSAAKAELEATS